MTPFTFRLAALGLLALAGCATQTQVRNADLPESIRVPAGHAQTLYTVGRGEITYECREKKDATGFEWAFVAPVATLADEKGMLVGKYFAGPTWESNDGSRVSGKQVAISPAASGNIPLQLVKANPSSGEGAMKDISYIQRLKTVGGVPPALPCGATQKGSQQVVPYSADYVFYRPVK